VRFTCPQGHRWELTFLGEYQAAALKVSCPICGVAIQLAAPTLEPSELGQPAPSSLCPSSAAPETVWLAPPSGPDVRNEAKTLPPPIPHLPQAEAVPPSAAAAHTETFARDHLAIPGYEILAEVGRGGMGVVYQARQTSLNRIVALKMILAGDHAGASQRARFRTEAEAVAKLQHPNIIQIFEIGEHNGLPYLSLEFVDGGSLAEQLDGTPQPAPQAAALVATLARAMHAAHQRSIVHRDLKPANVLLQVEGAETLGWGTPKITDFGLAKKLEDSSGLTATGAVLGTPSYMAPEQAGGQNEAIGPAADIYALGAILYELLTGRPPFKATTPLDTLMQVVSKEPVPPSRLNSGVPRDLETVCLKCLEKDPRKRYGSALALAHDLQLYLDDKPILARPVSKGERLWRWCRRNPKFAGTAALASLLLLVVLIGSPLTALRLRQERDAAEEARRDSEAARRDATDKLWGSYLAQARAGRWSGQAGRRFDSLDALAKAAEMRPALELRNEAIACMALADLRVAQEWDAVPAGTKVVVFDQQLEQYARGDSLGRVSVRRVADDQEIVRLPGAGSGFRSFGFLRFSPNGQYLAVGYCDNQWHVRVWDLKQQKNCLHLAGFDPQQAVDFRMDSREVAVGMPNGAIARHELPSGALRRTLAPGLPFYTVRYDPLGHELAVSSRDAMAVQIRDVETGKVRQQWPLPGQARGVSWSSDGELLAVACADGRVYLWNTRSGKQHAALEHDMVVTDVTFNHGGDLLASSGWGGVLHLWEPRSGKSVLTLPGTSAMSYLCLQFSPDDRLLAYNLPVSHSKLSLWEVAPGRECRRIPQVGDPKNRRWSTDISPDGRLLTLAREDGVWIWDILAGKEVAWLPIGQTRSALFQPNQKALITWGTRGLFRWPIASLKEGDGLSLGPPEYLRVSCSPLAEWACMDRQGRVVAMGDRGAGQVTVFDLESRKVLLRARQANPSAIALSPDGQWLASGTWNDPAIRVRVWNVSSGQLAAEWRGSSGVQVSFSPDGRWLVIGTGDEYQFYHVGSWVQGRVLAAPRGGGSMAWSPDSSILAIAYAPGIVRLVDLDRDQELASLPASALACFSRDGSQLVTAGEVWNLRQIRQQLAQI
jgi:WD40 repeat protein